MISKKSNYIASTAAIAGAVAVFSLFTFLMIFFQVNTPSRVFVYLLFSVASFVLLRRVRFFEKTTFDESGVAFYKLGKRIGFLDWDDIYELTIVESRPITTRGTTFSIPYLAVLTEGHSTIPSIDSGKATNTDINGRRMKLNNNSYSLAWCFGIGTADINTFIKHLKARRPDFFKKKKTNLSCVGYD